MKRNIPHPLHQHPHAGQIFAMPALQPPYFCLLKSFWGAKSKKEGVESERAVFLAGIS